MHFFNANTRTHTHTRENTHTFAVNFPLRRTLRDKSPILLLHSGNLPFKKKKKHTNMHKRMYSHSLRIWSRLQCPECVSLQQEVGLQM